MMPNILVGSSLWLDFISLDNRLALELNTSKDILTC